MPMFRLSPCYLSFYAHQVNGMSKANRAAKRLGYSKKNHSLSRSLSSAGYSFEVIACWMGRVDVSGPDSDKLLVLKTNNVI